MPNYFMAKHVFFCVHGGYVVFLDLRNDKYFALERRMANSVLQNVQGWQPVAEIPDAAVPASTQTDPDRTLQMLLDKGLLTDNRAAGKEAAVTAFEAVDSQLVTDLSEERSSLHIGDVARLLSATTAAWMALRLLSLERVVLRVQKRKQHLTTDLRRVNLDCARERVALYERMRPFVFGARDACLFESLVQLEYLARYGLYPTWVFGVRTMPFGAHCWVQSGSVVFNDSVGHVRAFMPIMTI